MAIAAAQCREWITATWPGTPISRFACRNTAGGDISQHSAFGSPRPPWTDLDDSNALDVFGPGQTDSASDQAYIQAIVDTIMADGPDKWSIRAMLWKDGGAHENHAHLDFWPRIRVKKWCGGPETPPWDFSNGTRIYSRDPEPEHGRYDGSGSDPVPIPPGPGIPGTPGGTMYLPLQYSDGFSSNPARREDVKWLQLALSQVGIDIGQDGIDGKYGNDTANAVASLMADGRDGRTYGYDAHQKLLTISGDGPGGFVPHTHSTSAGEPV